MECFSRAALFEEAASLIAVAEAEGRDRLTPDELKRFNDLHEAMNKLPRGAPSITAPAPLAGDGWRVSTSPLWPHRDLQALADSITRICFPWGTSVDWQWRFGVLEGRYAGFAAVTLFQPRLVVVDESKLAARSDIERDLQETVVHELSHVQVGTEDGPDNPAGEPRHSNLFYSG